MGDDQRQDERTAGSTMTVEAWGADRDALEMAALDVARKFYGPDVALEVIGGYSARAWPDHEPGRRYHASVTIREL